MRAWQFRKSWVYSPSFRKCLWFEAGTSAFIIKPLEIASAGLLVLLITLVLVGVSFRYFLRMPLLWVDEAASLVFIWLSMLGAVIAIDRGEHLRLTLFLRLYHRDCSSLFKSRR